MEHTVAFSLLATVNISHVQLGKWDLNRDSEELIADCNQGMGPASCIQDMLSLGYCQ